jgi:hypothetical protein
MDGNAENWIYPSSFNPCILRCALENGREVSTLYMQQTSDTMYVQLASTEKIFNEQDSLFRCELMEARDGGLPFLIVYDVIKIGDRKFDNVRYPVRFELCRQIIEDEEYFSQTSYMNEFRVRIPILYPLEQIDQVFTYIIPNMYGIAHGVAFIKDGFNDSTKVSGNNYLIRKTKLPEVYELYVDGTTPVPGNNIAYIPTLELAKKVKNFLANRNSARVKCEFNENRQKWVPIL